MITWSSKNKVTFNSHFDSDFTIYDIIVGVVEGSQYD